ncbi:MAG: M48 family metalloprotease [Bryobacteraceae bacterium]|nr:M48 family metalloprotease [Bryobacteraceae bacterium]
MQVRLPLLFLLLAPGAAYAQPQPASAHVNLYFAQIAEGQFDGGRWQTALTLVNSNPYDVAATIRLYGSDGSGLNVDFGAGLQSRHSVRVPANGSVTLASKPSSLPVRSGWAFVDASGPLMGSASFRLWLGGRAAQEVTAPPTLPVVEYVSYANRDLGVAVANPNNRTLRVQAYLYRSGGTELGPSLITLPPYGHTAFNVKDRFPQADLSDSMLLLTAADPPADEFLAWTMNADPGGTFSSLPPGGVTPPISHWDRIWNVYLRVLGSARHYGFLTGSSPRLLIRYDRQVNAYAKGGSEIGIYMGLSELLGDSDSELAFVVGHELGHILQQRAGDLRVWHPSNAEFDADIWGVLFAMTAGYDAYAIAGALSKLAMATGSAGLMTQMFEDSLPVPDAHRSFNTRMDVAYDFLTLLCATDVGRPFCQEYKRIMHPHLPDSAPLQADGLERLGFRKPSEAASMAAALRARLASAEETEQAPPDKQAQQ